MGMFLCIALLGLDLIAFFLGGLTSLGPVVVAFLVPVIVMSAYTLVHIEKDHSPSVAHH
ncbi:MAG: hypothetical protein ABF990_08670 [Acetobacter sp.]|uniref:hypothetical protein n=2 Tax=Acetobacter sp. TaxID=440 RepID=UPI0039E779BA